MDCPFDRASEDLGNIVGQNLIFRETDRAIPPYDGHHVQVHELHAWSRRVDVSARRQIVRSGVRQGEQR